MTTTTQPAPTPGYNCRLRIFFTTGAGGRRLAYRWSPVQLRAFRLPLDTAEVMRATGTADVVCCHPLRPHTCAKAGRVSARPGRRRIGRPPRVTRWAPPATPPRPYPAWDALAPAVQDHAAGCPACSFAPDTITLCPDGAALTAPAGRPQSRRLSPERVRSAAQAGDDAATRSLAGHPGDYERAGKAAVGAQVAALLALHGAGRWS